MKKFITFLLMISFWACSGSDDKTIEEYEYSTLLSVSSEDSSQNFLSPRSLEIVDEKIFLLDGYEDFVKVLNLNGEPLYSFGKKGSGPGELERPAKLISDSNGNILIYDIKNRRLNYFTQTGEFISSTSLSKIPFNLDLDSKDGIYIENKEYIDFKQAKSVYRLIYKLNDQVVTIDSCSEKGTFLREKEFTGPMPFPYQGKMFWRLLPNGNLFVVFSEDYRIKIYDGSHRLVKEALIEAPKIKVTDNDKEEFFNRMRIVGPAGRSDGAPASIRNKIKFPTYKPFVEAVFINEPEKKIYLKTSRGNDQYSVFDIFDFTGNFIKEVEVKEGVLNYPFFQGKIVYDIKTDETGETVISKLERK